MDTKFTEKLGLWLSTAPEQRNLKEGAVLLLQLSGNVIEHRNLMRDPASKAEYIESRLQKYYDYRVQDLTHAKVAEMDAQVEDIIKSNIPLAAKADTAIRGRRDDHDLLPDNIKALFTENLSLLQRMREVHLQLRKLSDSKAVCPDSERFPFLKELIQLDKKLRSNWQSYDTYKG